MTGSRGAGCRPRSLEAASARMAARHQHGVEGCHDRACHDLDPDQTRMVHILGRADGDTVQQIAMAALILGVQSQHLVDRIGDESFRL